MTLQSGGSRIHGLGRARELVMSGRLACLRGTQQAVLFAYASHANRDGGAYPACETIAAALGVSTQTVKRARKDLVAKGFLIDTGRKPTGRCRAPKIFTVVGMADEPAGAQDAAPAADEPGARAPIPLSAKGTPKGAVGPAPKGTPRSPLGTAPTERVTVPLVSEAKPSPRDPKGHPAPAKGTNGALQGDTAVSPEGVERQEEEEKSVRAPSTDKQLRAAEIYEAYPRKVARKKALKAIAAAARRIAASPSHPARADPWGHLLGFTRNFAASASGQPPPDDNDYRPYPATFFNNDRFDDAPSAWTKPNGRFTTKAQRNHSPANRQPGQPQRPGEYPQPQAPSPPDDENVA